MRTMSVLCKTGNCVKLSGIIPTRATWSKHLPISDCIFENSKHNFIKKVEEFLPQQRAFKKDATLAGVLVPFCKVDGKPSILFTKRSAKIVRNKSDVSFPGGKMHHDVDKNIIDTALRETMEEIGVPKSAIDVWTEMKPVLGSTDGSISIAPVFGFINSLDLSKLIIDKNEVSSVFTVTLEDLCDPNKQAYTKLKRGTIMPLFLQEPFKIWGITAIILDVCLANLLPHFYVLRYQRATR